MPSSFDYTIAILPQNKFDFNLELKHIKAALLYADKINLISPIASTYINMTNPSFLKNEKGAFALLEDMLPIIRLCDYGFSLQVVSMLNEVAPIVSSKQFKQLPLVERIKFQREMASFVEKVPNALEQMLGVDNCKELATLVNTNRLNIIQFDNPIDNMDDYISEYIARLESAINSGSTYPLLDEGTGSLLTAASNAGIIDISDIQRDKIKHAGLSNETLTALPSFDLASVDEILDIRKELDKALIRFRAKMLSYSDQIQSMPWDKDFQNECSLLYTKEISPALLEIEELCNDTSFLKNLSTRTLNDDSLPAGLASVGGLCVSVGAASTLSLFMDFVSANQAALFVAGAWTTTKIAQAFGDYIKGKRDASRKDLYFYYKASANLKKLRL